MSVLEAISQRRSQKTFTAQPVSEEQIRSLLESAVLAPNHKMTEPWSFVVLGERARRRYGEIKAELKVGADAEGGAAAKRAKIADEIAAVPAVIAVKQRMDEDAVRREEDYAAIFMGIQNMLLLATSTGLGSKVHTGKVLDHAALRDLIRAGAHERVVALVHLGHPGEEMKPKPRVPAAEKTTWLP